MLNANPAHAPQPNLHIEIREAVRTVFINFHHLETLRLIATPEMAAVLVQKRKQMSELDQQANDELTTSIVQGMKANILAASIAAPHAERVQQLRDSVDRATKEITLIENEVSISGRKVSLPNSLDDHSVNKHYETARKYAEETVDFYSSEDTHSSLVQTLQITLRLANLFGAEDLSKKVYRLEESLREATSFQKDIFDRFVALALKDTALQTRVLEGLSVSVATDLIDQLTRETLPSASDYISHQIRLLDADEVFEATVTELFRGQNTLVALTGLNLPAKKVSPAEYALRLRIEAFITQDAKRIYDL